MCILEQLAKSGLESMRTHQSVENVGERWWGVGDMSGLGVSQQKEQYNLCSKTHSESD